MNEKNQNINEEVIGPVIVNPNGDDTQEEQFNVYPGDVMGIGNVITDDDMIIGNNKDEDLIVENDKDENDGHIILNNEDEKIQVNDEQDDIDNSLNGEIEDTQINDENEFDQEASDEENIDSEQYMNVSFKDIDDEINKLNDEKEQIEQQIRDLMDRKDEIDLLIKEKQEALDYKKEVEVTTDKLKMYIKDLEVKPGAVRDALANLMNNMDK